MSNKITILDTETGEKKEVSTDADAFYWAGGNGSCDCNRELEFGIELDDKDYCIGEKRYLIVEHDYVGYSVRDFNESYPDELVNEHFKE